MRNIPEIRFKGFTDAWGQCKLGEVASFRRGSFPQPYGLPEWYDEENGLPFVQVVDVGSDMRLVDDTKQKISELAQPKSVYVPEGRVVVTLQGSIGRVAITQYPSYVDRTLLIFEDYNIATDEYFWAYVIQQKFDIEKQTAPGGTIKTITKEVLSDFMVSLPTQAEQTAIGNFFRTLNNALTLHKRKCEALKRLKKAYLQMMFPQSRESVPRVRFKGFTGEWEQRNLGDVAEIASGGTPDTTNSDYWDGDIDWYSPVEIGKEIYAFSSQRKITELGLKKSSAKILPANRTILFTSRAGIGDMAILKNSAATNQGFQSLVVNNDFDVYFIYSMGSKIKEYALKNASGSTFLEISGKGLSKMDMLTPSTEEQTTIGNFFYNLDEQITTQQTKLNKLNQLKQAYLQKMFV